MSHKLLIVGLTGNYGMGKSAVARMFGELGAITIDTDEIVRELLREPDVIEKIKNTFGDEIIEGSGVNKKLLANTVFRYPHLRISLEDILHPRVFKKIDEELAKLNRDAIVVIEAPVIFERGYQNRFDKIITVFTSEDIAVSRLAKKGISEEDARSRLKSQFPIEMKISKADYVIDNNGDLEDTKKQIEKIYNELLCG
jgi:dephospho-CoA kinase